MPPVLVGDRETLVSLLTETLASRGEVLEAYLFGSHARGDPQPHSDIDVAVYLDTDRVPSPTFGYAAELCTDLMKELGHDAVDVVILNGASPLLYHRVLRDGARVLARDLRATTAREGQALSRYCDFVPQLRKVELAHASRIRGGAFGR